ncbi:MAG: B12-binding domain-containing radical SAM protein [Defluviitaleaceae bacterium]|nr:B12-binding domain-containing radical SAM protein [Defluviitaleaceae bacterium]
MKVALINPPFRGLLNFGDSTFPLGLGYLKAMCKESNINCDIFDFSDSLLSDEELCNNYNLLNYDIIGISTYTPNFRDTAIFAKHLKTKKNIILLGGHHVNLVGSKILEDFPFIDYLLRGYAEYTFVDFIKFQNSNDLYKIPGLCYKINDKVYSNVDKNDNLELDILPRPDHSDIIFDFPSDGIEISQLPVLSSRGCTFRCSFCVHCKKSVWDTRNIKEVIKEISDNLKENDYKIINFVDCNFFINPERAIELIKEISKLNHDITITFQTRSDQIVKNEEAVRYLLNNHNVRIYLGIESNNVEVLKRFNKKTTPLINQLAINIIKDYYSDITIYIIMFEAISALHEIRETFDFIKSNKLFNIQNSGGLYQTIIPFYRTDYFDKFKSYYEIDLHSISKPIYVNKDVENLKICFDTFIDEYDDTIKEKLRQIKNHKVLGLEVNIKDFKFFSSIYFYVFEFFLILAEKQLDFNYESLKTTQLYIELEKYLSKYS